MSIFADDQTLDVSRSSPEHTSISMTNPDITRAEVVENFETFHTFTLPGEFVIPEDGQPALPKITRLYRIPNTGGVDLVITGSEFHYESGVNPLPYRLDRQDFHRDHRDPTVYLRSQWFPRDIVTISEPMILRDFRVVEVTLYPVQVNPVTGQARVYDRIDVDLVANAQPSVNELTNPRRPNARWASIYRDMIRNLDERTLDEVDPMPGTYMIIQDADGTADGFVDSLETWKRRRGFDVVVDRRSNWSASTINTAVTALYNSSDPPLEFVALIGDPSAAFGVPVDGTGTNGSYDHNYALTAGGDDLEDVAVGRFCGVSSGEMATIRAKLMAYERTPYMSDTDWFTSSFLYAGLDLDIESNLQLMQWSDMSFAHNTGIVNNTVATYTGSVSETLVENELEDGRGIFFWRGTWLYEMDTGLASSCDVGPRLPIVLTITCSAGDYVGELGVSESYLVAGTPSGMKGGVAAIGSATWDTHAPQNICVTGGLSYAIANQHIEHLGTCLAAAKLWLTKGFGADSYSATHFSRYNNLLGDPALSIWTDVPVVMDVTHPASLDVGAGRVQITVVEDGTAIPVEDALVVLWKGTETYVKGLTDASGQIDLPVSIDSAGDLLLTITKRNHKPYLADIACSSAPLMVSFESLTIDDDNSGGTIGNGNGQINPGETVDLSIVVRNHGTATTGSSISATLTTTNSNVIVHNGFSTYPNLPPGNQVAGNSDFRVEFAPTMVDGEACELLLEVTASSSTTYSLLGEVCHAGDVEYVSHTFIGGSFNPGDTRSLEVTIGNNGDEDMLGVTSTLVSMSPFVSVADGNGTHGTITVGNTATNTANRFAIAGNPFTYPGHQAMMELITETSDGNPDTTFFTVSVGTAAATDPTGPDDHGYYAYDNSDVSYFEAPSYSYVNISSGLGTNLNLNDPGDKTSTTPTYATARRLPFDFDFYGVHYDSVTICSNGWLAFGNQSWNDAFRNYPIPSMVAPEALVAPYWDDLKTNGGSQGVWEHHDTANHRYIVQWKASVGGSSYNYASLDFQVILLDEDYYPTADGNGKILIQYADVAMNQEGSGSNETSGCSIGIQDVSGLVGLPFVHKVDYEPGAATVVDGRAILFTTNGPGEFIEVTAPDSGEYWYVGHQNEIEWQSIGFDGDVKIEINRSYPGPSWETLLATTDNDGNERWTVIGPATTTARIRVASVSDPSVADTSEYNFTIASPSISLVEPNGGEIAPPDETLTVIWSGAGHGTAVLELNRDYPTGAWEELESGVADRYDWTVTVPPTLHARIRVTSQLVPTLFDVSDNDFTIGAAPDVTHNPLADMEQGTATFIALITDDAPGFSTTVYHRAVGAGSYDSLPLTVTGNPDEYSGSVPITSDGEYEYYLECVDTEDFETRVPETGHYAFQVGDLCDSWIQHDDGTAENYNWVNGPGFQWAVYFDPGSYPFTLCASRYAINPTNPTSLHGPAIVRVLLADGPGGEPGTILWTDTTGSVNQVGGLPAGAAWTNVLILEGGQPLQVNEPFYVSVTNPEPFDCPVAFGLDSSSTPAGHSYLYDPCDSLWMPESADHFNARNGNRMIRICGFGFLPPVVTISSSGNNVILRWNDTGAPYYKVYSAANSDGPFDTYLGSTPTLSFTDPGIVLTDDIRFYHVRSSTQP